MDDKDGETPAEGRMGSRQLDVRWDPTGSWDRTGATLDKVKMEKSPWLIVMPP